MPLAQDDRIQCVHVAYSQLSRMLHFAHGAQKEIIGQVEVKNEFNQAHLRLNDIYCSLNRINIDFHFAYEITVTGYHFSMS